MYHEKAHVGTLFQSVSKEHVGEFQGGNDYKSPAPVKHTQIPVSIICDVTRQLFEGDRGQL